MNKAIDKKQVIALASVADYIEGGIARQEILRSETGSVTVLSFDAGQGLGTHTAQFEVMIQILDGEGEFTIEGEVFHPKAGEILIIPKNAVHSVSAKVRFKMMLTKI